MFQCSNVPVFQLKKSLVRKSHEKILGSTNNFEPGTLEHWNKGAGFFLFFEKSISESKLIYFFVRFSFFRFRFLFSTDLTKDVSYIFFVLKKKFQGKSSSVLVFQCSSVPVFQCSSVFRSPISQNQKRFFREHQQF